MQVVFQGDEPTVRYRVLAHPGSGWLVGVREYPGHPDSAFDEFRTGLDHLAFAVSSLEDLQAWEGRLREMGVHFSPIASTPIGTVVVFRDPDGIQLEFWLPAGQ
jgi:glyoxylase I family protein